MKNKTDFNRRQFLATTSAAVVGAAALQGKELPAEKLPECSFCYELGGRLAQRIFQILTVQM